MARKEMEALNSILYSEPSRLIRDAICSKHKREI